jgi:hypothetical protein
MKLSDLGPESGENSGTYLQETKSSPSLKQTFLYHQKRNSIIVVSKDDQNKKPLSGIWDAIRNFIYVSSFQTFAHSSFSKYLQNNHLCSQCSCQSVILTASALITCHGNYGILCKTFLTL